MPATDKTEGRGIGFSPMLKPSAPIAEWIFTFLLLAVFSGACAFWRYLSTGQWFEFLISSYLHDAAIPLCREFLQPLSIFSHPWMIFTNGLILSVIFIVPLAVVVFYRAYIVVILVLIIAIIGHSPILAGVSGVGCLLASVTRWRRDAPLAAILLGLIPLVGYIYFSHSVGVETSGLQPVQRWVFALPFLVVLLGTILSSTGIMILWRFGAMRSFIILLVMTVICILAAGVFFCKVGSDRLDYAILLDDFFGERGLLERGDVSKWRQRFSTGGLHGQSLRGGVIDHLEQKKTLLRNRCRNFLDRHPRSNLRAAVMWFDAQRASLQLDTESFDAGRVRFTASFPSFASENTWRDLSSKFSQSPHAILADKNLAELSIRKIAQKAGTSSCDEDGAKLLSDAMEKLARVQERLEKYGLEKDSSAAIRQDPFFPKPIVLPSNKIYADALLSVKKLRWLIEKNDVMDDNSCCETLSAWMNINPHEPGYVEELKKIHRDDIRKDEYGLYRNSSLGGNIALAIAQAETDLRKKYDALVLIAEGYNNDPDAAIEANYELGKMAINMRSKPSHGIELKDPCEYLKYVRDWRQSPWREFAERYMDLKKTASKPSGKNEK